MLSACLHKFLRDYLPDEMSVYRGSLRMPKDSTQADHQRTKRAFFQAMRRWKKRTGYTFEVYGIQHISDDFNCHWDCTAYSDASVTPLKAAVSRAWKNAGGKSQSLMPLDSHEIESQCKYQAKDVTRERIKGRQYLPASGIQFQWSTQPTADSPGFWRGHAIKSLWKELCAEWFPKSDWRAEYDAANPGNRWQVADDMARESSTDELEDMLATTTNDAVITAVKTELGSNPEYTLLASTDTPKPSLDSPPILAVRAALMERQKAVQVEAKSVYSGLDTHPDSVANRERLLAEIDRLESTRPQRDRANIQEILPESPKDGIGLAALAALAGIPLVEARLLLRGIPGARQTDGEILPNGKTTYNAWYRP